MITPSQIPNPYVKPKWRASVGMMESVVAYNCRKYGMPLPVMAMPMWEGAGNRAIDLSGRGNHGTLINEPKWTGGGLDFDGVDDHVNAGNNASKDVSYVTVSAKFKLDTMSSPDSAFIGLAGCWETANNERQYELYIYYTTSKLRFDRSSDGSYSSGQYKYAETPIVINKWYHVVGVWDEDNNALIYVNGELKAQNTVGTATGAINTVNTSDLLLGAHSTAGTPYREFDGIIDEVCIFNTALSAAQIKFLYDNPYFMYRMPEELYGYAAEAGNIINKQIELGTDDCYEDDDTTATLDTDNVYVGYLTPSAYDIGLRWQSINIPQGASITSAKLSIYLYADTGTLSANIRGIDEDNTLTWATDDRPSQRDKTSATITANEANWSNWVVQDWAYIDITSVIQEIIDRGGWSANNDLAIVIEDTAGTGANYIAMRAYELAGNLHGAKLEIEYGDAGITIPVIIHHLREQGIL